jgi:hypothetical protein
MPRRKLAAAIASIALYLCSAGLSGCNSPGKGAKAEAGYNNARPVIAALKRYHDRQNDYPPALRDLVPADLAESAWRTPEGTGVSEFFEYKKSGSSYQLKFSYTGPGMNQCVYTPEAGKWECVGHY